MFKGSCFAGFLREYLMGILDKQYFPVEILRRKLIDKSVIFISFHILQLPFYQRTYNHEFQIDLIT